MSTEVTDFLLVDFRSDRFYRSFVSGGAPDESIGYQEHELEGVQEAVEWSQRGDVLILLIHEDVERVTEYLSSLSR